jgi:hypothetical protein
MEGRSSAEAPTRTCAETRLPTHVLEVDVAEVDLRDAVEHVAHPLHHGGGHDDIAGNRVVLEAGGNVYALAEEVVLLDDSLAGMHAHAEHQAAVGALLMR